ncbi:hypothetical protein EDD15DRAFT_1482494 [Pisolithus albus]|nr:hypothetical protein EDD15DRAFT_1482494 [Pisolithus albus]
MAEFILLLAASILLLMITVTLGETIPSMSHIISTVVKVARSYRCFLLASEWITNHFPEVQGWAIVCVVILVFVLVPRLGRAFVRRLGFGIKGVTKGGSIAALYQSRRLGGLIPAGSMFSLLHQTSMASGGGLCILFFEVFKLLCGCSICVWWCG